MNLITLAINHVGLKPLAAKCGVTYQAVKKWEAKGCLPRTDWTGETRYAQIIEQVTDGKIPAETLLKRKKSA